MLVFTLRMIKTARGLERGAQMIEITNGLRLISVKLRGYEQSLLKVKTSYHWYKLSGIT